MWKSVCARSIGTSHESRGEPCQDFGLANSVQAHGQTVFVAVCSDGAGSAKQSEVGSRLACEKMCGLISTEIGNELMIVDIDREQMLRWHEVVVGALETEAESRELTRRDLACTLLTAIVAEDVAVFSQIGDGAIVISTGGSFQPVFWPQSGEYINTTNFLTDFKLGQDLEFTLHKGVVEEIAILTDGLQMLALNYAEKKAHGPFFLPLFKTLREAKPEDGLVDSLCQFLSSPRVNQRTDDDKTLIVATRRTPDAISETI
jgi:hypothetical protein